VKQFLRNLLARLGFIVVRRTHAQARYLTLVSPTPLDEALFRVFPSLTGLSFVQVGANDGRRLDPVCRHIAACGWRGVFVEPDPDLFSQLRRNYGAQDRFAFLNAAVDVAAGQQTLHFIRPDLPALPDWVHGVGSLRRAHLENVAEHLNLPADAIASRPITTITWDDVFAALGSARPDVLVIDTEGHDAVLLDCLDFARHAPRVLHFEHACISAADRLRLYGRLIDLGYEIASFGPDTTAYRTAP
jgi:FkbM family methyltransferase